MNRRSPVTLLAALLACIPIPLWSCGGGGGGGTELVGTHPSAATSPVGDLGPDRATLRGTVSSNGRPTTCWFEWGTDPSLSGSASTQTRELDAKASNAPVQETVTGLTHGTRYYYRVVARNSDGTRKGIVESFTSLTVPKVTTQSPADLSETGATLRGIVNPNGLETVAWFEWGTDNALASFQTAPDQRMGTGAADNAFSDPLGGLTPGTSYYYRAAARNSSGTRKGDIVGFVALKVPSATTDPATGFHLVEATLNGTVNPNGKDTVAWFEWGTDNTLATFSVTGNQPLGAGTDDLAVSSTLLSSDGLANNTTYYYRVAARNADGTQKGIILQFHVFPYYFTDTGGMVRARTGHTATLLLSGKVLVVGGRSRSDNTVGSTAEIYDPATGSFTRTGDMTGLIAGVPVTEYRTGGHTATLLPDDNVLVAGGQNRNDNTVYATAWIYYPTLGIFVPTDNMSVPRAGHTATRLADGTLLIAGGIGNDNVTHASAEIYDPVLRRFTPTASPMNQGRRNHTANLLPDNTVLIAGGGYGAGDNSITLSSAERYDPANQMFLPAGYMLQARESQVAMLLPDNTVLLAGGLVPKDNQVLHTAELYNPANPPATAQTGSMVTPHSGVTGTYFLVGVLITGSSEPPIAEIYPWLGGVFVPAANVNVNRAGHTSTLLLDGRVLVCGGVAEGETLSSAELFQ